ncbi:beta-1,6-galactofuranosyltransferase [Limosilactobacillus kribbianus]|uniref:beta-1,6-galactofuranosyltransferase n=1 Tax=Limosilactobacillus kribbianus TaxID=2982695 RepID=UPI002263F3AA|nr:beta-1,6-galactofuranosyltransferase [Limosilactobacillus kribbianus]
MVADFAEHDLNYQSTGIYFYDQTGEKPGELSARQDGILASLGAGDVFILQTPTWNSVEWETMLMAKVSLYRDVKKVIFVHDVIPLMFASNRYLMKDWLRVYNMADVIILPTQRMADVLRKEGLKVKNIIIQQMWDHPANIDWRQEVKYRPLVNFAGNPAKFGFLDQWTTDKVDLRVFAKQPSKPLANPEHVKYAGWYNDPDLLSTLRRDGGFGLVWGTNDDNLVEYMKMDCSYKLSTYLAAGLPIIVQEWNPVAALVRRKHLGLVVKTLEDAMEQVYAMTSKQYRPLASAADQFGSLIRNGYFTKRALIESVFEAFYN